MARKILGTRAAAAALLVVGLSANTVLSAAHAVPVLVDVCDEAQALVEKGFPADAMALIDRARELELDGTDETIPTAEPTVSPTAVPEPSEGATAQSSSAGLCEAQYADALALSYSPAAATAAICVVAASFISAGDYDSAIAVIEDARTAAGDRLASGDVVVVPTGTPGTTVPSTPDPAADPSAICGAELQQARMGANASFGSIASAWSDFRTANIDPLFPAATVVAFAILGFIILTRLLMTVPFLSDRLTRKEDRRAMGIFGTIGIVLAPVAAVAVTPAECGRDSFSGCATGFISWDAVIAVTFWLAVGIASAFALAFALGSRMRLAVQGRGSVTIAPAKEEAAADAGSANRAAADAASAKKDGESKTEKAAADQTKKDESTVNAKAAGTSTDPKPLPFLAHLREIGGGPARGVEVPTGTDVTGVAPLVAEMPNSKVLQWFVKAWDLIVNATPWKVTIDDADTASDAVVVTVLRNGRAVAQEIVRVRDVTRLIDDDSFDAAKRAEILASLAAAYVLWTLRERYESELGPGLYGATRWEGLAYHYIATAVLGYEQQAKAVKLLEAAVQVDRYNRLAQTTLWLYRYRDSRRPEELEPYRHWLQLQLQEHLASGDAQRELSIRQWMTHAALVRNLRALGPRPDLENTAPTGKAIEAIRSEIRALLVDEPKDLASRALFHTWRQLWAINAVREKRDGPDQPKLDAQEKEWWHSAERSSHPVVAFSLACHMAMSYKELHPPLCAGVGGVGLGSEAAVVVERLLRIARVEPVLADWEPYDPELAGFAGRDSSARLSSEPRALRISDKRIRLKGPKASALAARVLAGADLDGFGLTALQLMADGQKGVANEAWLHANRMSPAGRAEASRLYHALRDVYGYSGTETDVKQWMETLGTATLKPAVSPASAATLASSPASTSRSVGLAFLWRRRDR